MTEEQTRVVFRRATRADAIELASSRLTRGERLDIQSLANDLGVNRSTVHRWVGDRDSLVGEAMRAPAEALWDQVLVRAEGDGVDGAVDTIRRYMTITSQQPGMVAFVEREPDVALRILMTPGTVAAEVVNAGLRRTVARFLPEADVSDQTLAVINQVGTVLAWANIAAGRAPAIEQATSTIRTILESAVAGSDAE